jgi:hypothetical protein
MGATPDEEYTEARSALATPPTLGRGCIWWMPLAVSTFALSTLRGRLSLLLPNSDEGASARTDASVSSELRRLRLDDEARVSTEALSDNMLFAMAAVYVCGCGAR